MKVVLVVLLVVLLVLLVTCENKVNSYSDQLKLCQVCKFGVEFDNNCQINGALPNSLMGSCTVQLYH